MATGAAVAAPDRPVLCLQADGSAMYTLQALWTQAREGLNVTTVVLSNRSYAILNMELHRVGADAGGPAGPAALDLTEPDLDFCDSPAAWACRRTEPRTRRTSRPHSKRASPKQDPRSSKCCSDRAPGGSTVRQRIDQSADNSTPNRAERL